MKYVVVFLSSFFLSFSLLFHYYRETVKDLPPPEERVPTSARIYYSNGDPLYIPRVEWISLKDVPEIFVKILLNSEDRRFFEHHGVDFRGIFRAILTNIKSGEIVQGGSTITQQLARLLYLTHERTVRRKVKEIFIALWLEKRLSKYEILELYMNSVYLGNGIYGFQTASVYYFGKELKHLNVAEMASLVATVRSPERYNPKSDLDLSKEKGKVVLESAFENGVIDGDEFEKALEDLEHLEVKITERNVDEEVFWRVVNEVKELTGLDIGALREGYEIYTTLDESLQNVVETEVGTRGACVAVDNLGRILAYKGLGAGNGRRHTGSAVKPVYYLLALLNGVKPMDLLPDLPVDIGGWKPENFTKRFRGESTVLNALVYSRNVPSVFLFSHIGPGNVRSFMENVLGIEGVYPDDMTLALGTVETAPEQILKFYTALMTGGLVLKPTIVERVIGEEGDVIYSFRPTVLGRIPDGVVSAYRAIATLKGMMRDVVIRGTGVRARIEGVEMFGKTGTSDMNAWFIGASDHFAMALVVDGRDLLGGRDVAPVWKDIVERWGKFEGGFLYLKPDDGGDIVFDEAFFDYVDFTEVASLVRSGDIGVDDLVDLLVDLDPEKRTTFLKRLEGVDPEITSWIEEVMEWRR